MSRETARRRPPTAAWLMGIAAAGTLPLQAAAPTVAQAAATDTLVIARAMDTNTTDPARSWCDTCQIYLSAVYETVVTVAPDNVTIVPSLADRWEVNGDNTEVVVHLNADATFDDGSPVEAKDVMWSWERLRNIKAPPSFMVESIKSYEQIDAKTLKVTLKAPNSEIIGIMAAPYMGVTNSDVAKAQGANADADADKTDNAETWFLENSAGSGPYKLARYRPEDELRLARNENYWGTPAPIKTVVIKQAKDAVTQAQMLESGAADVAMQVDPDTARSIRSKDIVTSTVPSFNFVYVALSPGAKENKVELTHKVREAFGYALDYEGLIDLTLGGDGKLQAAAIPNGFPGTEDLPLPKHDLAKAKALLAEAGHAGGFELETVYPNVNVYGVDFSTMMQKVQQDVAKVGIKLNLQPVTFGVWVPKINSDGIPLTAVYYAPDFFGTSQYVDYFAMKDGASWYKRASRSGSDASIKNSKVDALLTKALSVSGDAQRKHYHEIGMEMIKDRIIFPIASPNLVLAHHKDVKGVRYSVCCNLPLAELSR